MELLLLTHTERIKAVYEKLLSCLEVLEKKKDSRATFTYAYYIMTKTIEKNFSNANFQNPEWIVSLTETFAGHYFNALLSYDKNQTAPGGWQKAFDTICKCGTSVMEELIICMYVHIMQDLSFSLRDLNKGNPRYDVHIGDFHQMNNILQESIDAIQDMVCKRYNPYMHWLDVIGKNRDEIFTNYGIRICRSMSWYNSTRMLIPALQNETIASFEKSSSVFIDDVRWNKSWLIRNLLGALRFFLNLTRKWERKKIEDEK